MPKIKVKNIPFKTQDRICSKNRDCLQCPFYTDDAMVVNNYLEHITCLRDARYDPSPEEKIIDLTEDNFPTNREWLGNLSDDDLAAFYTLGIPLKDSSYISLYKVAKSFTSSQQGIKEWLSKPCLYLMEEE